MLDVQRFWEENRLCANRPFSVDKPRAALTLSVDDHWLIEEMAVPSTVRYFEDAEYQARTNRECNDRCEESIGLRPFSEVPFGARPLRIEELFGSHMVVTEGGTPWLEPGHETTESFEAKLDELASMSEDEVFSAAFSTGAAVTECAGATTVWSRGPTTVGCSVLGPERFLYWLLDEPDLMHRFYEVFAQTHLAYHRSITRRQGQTIVGCAWLDDFCTLLSPDLYRQFALPAMRTVMDALDVKWRFQHSDSAMEHLLPVLAELRFDGVNFGPTVPVTAIRHWMPKAEIHGQIPPFMLRNGTADDVRRNVIRDFQAVGLDGGLVVTTAGSVAAGTTFEAMRSLMEAVEQHCRYDR